MTHHILIHQNVGFLRRTGEASELWNTSCTRQHVLCRASLCLEKQSIASLRQPKALLLFQTPFHLLRRLWRRDARPSVNWSASLGECRLRSLRVSVDEFTPRSSRHNEFRDAHHGGRVQDSLICCQEVCQQLLILVHTILCRSLNCCRFLIGLLRSLKSKMSSLSPVILKTS